MSPSGIHFNKICIVLVAGVFWAVVFLYYFKFSSSSSLSSSSSSSTSLSGAAKKNMDTSDFWSHWELKDLSADLLTVSDLVKDVTVDVSLGAKTMKVFTRQAKPAGSSSATADVLLLHGQAFTSENWKTIGSLSLLAHWGYQAIAIDLPGYGNTKSDGYDKSANGAFILEVIKVLKLNNPVIVSPSMSGSFSLPFLFDQPKGALQNSHGFVPVAPVLSEKFVDVYKKSQIPTMILYGEKDKTPMKDASINNLGKLPNSKAFEITDAGHACYMNNPKYFHQLLYNFLRLVTRNSAKHHD